MKKLLRAVLKQPGLDPEEVMIKNELEDLQRMVGGYIEVVPLPGTGDIIMVCNEEGKLRHMRYNFSIPGDSMYGPVLFLGRYMSEFYNIPVSADVIKGAILAWEAMK